ncbi:DUF992 domain-containing protein [Mesorhizobium sp. KR9-304]|uniref:DUF992 domain-containing protein n=1 Tax=Mesorhizobium sp. KR9-304 TaxID=3156614 RepID=UPI0032B36F21
MKYLLIAAASTALLAAIPAANSQTKGMELGVLDCKVEGGAGFIIGSTKDVLCTYRPADKNLGSENYHGTINKIGLDIGVTGQTLITWAVIAPNADLYAPGALAGDYVGASAEASAAIGAGANVLVGGSNRTFSLQPLSVQAQTGVNLAIGIAELKLRSAAG